MKYIEQAISEFDKKFTEELDRNFIGEYFQEQLKKFIEEKLQKAYELGEDETYSEIRRLNDTDLLEAENKAIQDYKKELLKWCEENKSFEDSYPNEDIIYLDKLTKHLTK